MHQKVENLIKCFVLFLFFTTDGRGLRVQSAGLVAKPLSCAVDPDVGDLALVPLWEAHVLLAHGLVEEGAVRHGRHRHLQPNTDLPLVSRFHKAPFLTANHFTRL